MLLIRCGESSPCKISGKCVNLPGSFRCDCTQGFTGKLCDQGDYQALFVNFHGFIINKSFS